MWNHNSDVDSPEKVTKLINRLLRNTSFNSCSGAYGEENDVPVFSTSESYPFCLSSSPGRAKETFDCKRFPTPKEQRKKRLCYCHEGKFILYQTNQRITLYL